MKYYNNFNDMYNNNMGSNQCSVFNYSEYDGRIFQQDIEHHIYEAVDEWYDGLSDKSKSNFAKFGLDWYDETGQGDKLDQTQGFKSICAMILSSGVDYTMRMMDRDIREILIGCLNKKHTEAREEYMNNFDFYTDYDGED